MTQLFMLILCLLSFSGAIFGSGRPTEIITLRVNFDIPTANCLVYSSIQNRNELQMLGINTKENEPFLPLPQLDLMHGDNAYELAHNKIVPIDSIPLSCILRNDQFKKTDETIFRIGTILGNRKKIYVVKMVMDNNLLSHYDADVLLSNFKEKPGFFLKDENELKERGLITVDGAHGPNGYFRLEEPELIKESSIDTPPSYFSYLKKPLFCLVGVVAIFTLYKKFYGYN